MKLITRSKIALNKSNEVILFVVSSDFQGAGIYSNLCLGFKTFVLLLEKNVCR